MREPDFLDSVTECFARARIPLAPEAAEKMAVYYGCLAEENKKHNLTAITGPGEAALHHFLDSAAPCALIPKGARVIDVGSGGGFPIVPLAILREDIKAFALEASRKKCAFIRAATQRAGVAISVTNARAEEYGREAGREAFDVAVSRAVAALPALVELCAPLVRLGGLFLAYKAAGAEELQSAQSAMTALCLRLEDRVKLPIAAYGREALVFKKTEKTDERYPRKYNQILKRPL